MSKQTMTKIKEQTMQEKANIYHEPALQKECCHYWLIESAAGPISHGVCRLCGMKRNFDNYLTNCLKAKGESV